MPLSQSAVEEFKAIHRQETGEDLTDDQAQTMANRLLRMYVLLLRPLDPDQD
jgi:hypothetical protein